MRGQDAIVKARLAGLRLSRIDVDVLPSGFKRERWEKPGIEWLAGVPVGRIEVDQRENAALLDLRCCRGLPVLVLAPSYADGWPVAQRIADVEPASLTFCAPDMAVRLTDEGMEAWEL